MVLQTHAEAIGNHDHRLVREAHAGLQGGLVAAYQISRFVDRKPDPMTSAVRQPGKRIVRTEPRFLQHLTRRGVDRFARRAGPDRVEGGRLRFMLQRPDPALFGIGLAEHIGTRDIAVIAFDHAARVDQDDVAFAQRRIAGKSMGIGAGAAELDDHEAIAAGRADRAMRLVEETGDLARADSFVKYRGGAALHLQRHRLGLLHERKLGGRLAHPAIVHHSAAVDERQRGRDLRDTVDKQEGHRRIDRQDVGAERAQGGSDQLGRALILFPQTKIGLDREAGLQCAKLEARRDHDRHAANREQHRDQALARPPRHAGEVAQARAGADQQRIGTHVARQAARGLDSGQPFLARDRGSGIGPWPDVLELALCRRSADALHTFSPIRIEPHAVRQ